MIKNNSFFNYVISLVLLICFIFLCVFSFADEDFGIVTTSGVPEEKITVVIDAGHGGEDSGAIGANGRFEKELNLEISFKVGEYLKAAGFNVAYTRTNDKLLYTDEENIKGIRKISDLKNRVKIANSYKNAILVSIHMNSFGAAECKGLQVYYSENSDAERLAALIQNSVKDRLQPANHRTIKKGNDIYILENATIPSVLIECGFLSNPDECAKLSQKEYQKELSFAILCGIIEYSK